MDIPDGARLELVDTFCYLGDVLSVDGDVDAAVEARVHKDWNKFRQFVPVLTNEYVSFILRGTLYRRCVHSCMLHGSETRPLNKKNNLTLQWAEVRMIMWMCGIKVTDKFTCSELRETLEQTDTHLTACFSEQPG